MTVDGVDRGSATAAPMSLTFSHATWGTVKTTGLSVPKVTLKQAAWLEQFRSGRDFLPRLAPMLQMLRVGLPSKRSPT